MAKMIKKVKKVIKEERMDCIDVDEIEGLEAIEIIARKFKQYDFDFTNSEVNIPKFNKDEIENAIVKVNIRIKQEDLSKISIKEMESEISKYCYILKPIVANIQRDKKVRNNKVTVELSPLEAVKAWLYGKNYKDINKIYELSEEIIREVGY